MAHFELIHDLADNSDGWGPSSVSEVIKDLPYHPYSKNDRIGKVADWTGSSYSYQQSRMGKSGPYGQQKGQNNAQAIGAVALIDEEAQFQLVDTSKVQKPIYQRQNNRFIENRMRRERDRKIQQQQQAQNVSGYGLTKTQKIIQMERNRQVKKMQRTSAKMYQEAQAKRESRTKQTRQSSVQVRDDWEVREDFEYAKLQKLFLKTVSEARDLVRAGELEYYDRAYDKVNVRNEKPLRRVNRIFYKASTAEDPVIRRLAKTTGNVYATDAIVATLMTATRSVNSWDIVATKLGSKLFLDRRDHSRFDLLSVNETAADPPNDDQLSINSAHNLALEATYINHNFSQQVLQQGEAKYQLEEANPFAEVAKLSAASKWRGDPNSSAVKQAELASVGYRYRMFDLGNNVQLVVRCEHDAVCRAPDGEGVQFWNIKTLNEFDPRSSGDNWRQKLDTQKGAVLATEIKNNASKLAKWTVCALLAGSDMIKFGYVSRVVWRDTTRHTILGTQQFKPLDLANQINLSMDNCWAVFRCIVETCMRQADGKYLIMKDPNRPIVRLYALPSDAFESDAEDDESSDSEDDDDNEDDAENRNEAGEEEAERPSDAAANRRVEADVTVEEPVASGKPRG